MLIHKLSFDFLRWPVLIYLLIAVNIESEQIFIVSQKSRD
jgi:hypothetical protein